VLIVMFVLMLVYDFVTRRTTIGRRIYALGGNAKAARLSGIKTERLAFLTFVNMGALAALAGLSSPRVSIPRRPRPVWVSSWT
jgi:putative multiple sugar transport system permease protein